MKKHLLKALLYGALVLTGFFSSCENYSDDIELLKSQVAHLQDAADALVSSLENVLTEGYTITKVEINNGTYTLTLSDDAKTVITINPTTPGNPGDGSTITVVENENNLIITIDGKEYVLPNNSLI